MAKVFCRECKHYCHNPFASRNVCFSNPGDTWRDKGAIYADPSKKNANNDCGEFEQYVPPPPPPEPPPLREIHYPAPWWRKFWRRGA